MSRSKLNIEELTSRLDEFLDSISMEETKEWLRFDQDRMREKRFYNGEFQRVDIVNVEKMQVCVIVNLQSDNEIEEDYLKAS